MNINYIFYVFLFLCLTNTGYAQFRVTEATNWDRYPAEVQKPGFGLHKSQRVQMDDSSELEEVLLFASDNGHYPYFDLFKCYYVIIGYYSKEVKYISEVTLSDQRELLLEDRNNDGKFELYRRYMKDGKFSVDKNGNNLKTEWRFDRIEYKNNEK
ncbi:hypothetical protein [Sphingobacterium sp. 18053]|uniref:hypothetical protein n=1 Tax=Sphingobacterium sp. 18053 TaxID=2681401 RepID=UPI00135AE1A1|nr:hypothetical protein [Sphingobacterium sp. 18053]